MGGRGKINLCHIYARSETGSAKAAHMIGRCVGPVKSVTFFRIAVISKVIFQVRRVVLGPYNKCAGKIKIKQSYFEKDKYGILYIL